MTATHVIDGGQAPEGASGEPGRLIPFGIMPLISVGNITGNYNVSTLSGNNVQIPVEIPAGYPLGVRRPWSWLSWSPQHPPSGTRRGLERDEP